MQGSEQLQGVSGPTASERREVERREKLEHTFYEVQQGRKTTQEAYELVSRYLKPIDVEEKTPEYVSKTLWELYLDSKKPQEVSKHIELPWRLLNGYMGSLRGGRLIVVGGSTGHGKSIWAVNVAIYAALNQEKTTVYSFEMRGIELMYRCYTNLSGVREEDLSFEGAYLTLEEPARIEAAQEQMKNMPLVIDDSCEESLELLIDKIEDDDSDLIIIDHIHNVEGKNENRILDLSNIARKLKKMAMQKKIPIIAMAQLKDRPHHLKGIMPSIDDLAWSSDIKKHADQVVLIHDRDQDDDQIMMQLGKNRGGTRSGQLLFKFEPMFCRISDWPSP